MGKVKPKRKSTLIDMTAMSDVTVLLLTFFMLTSTFLQKEPVTVITPSSVSEEKVPTANVATILVGTYEGKDKEGKDQEFGKVFLGISGDADSTVGSEKVRMAALRTAASTWESVTGKKSGITQGDIEKFSKLNMFGVPMADMHNFLNLSPEKQDKYMSELSSPNVGIPMNKISNTPYKENEFQIWMDAIRNASSQLGDAVKSGEGIAVKADANTNYSTMFTVLDNLQSLKMNKFSIMTALKSESD